VLEVHVVDQTDLDTARELLKPELSIVTDTDARRIDIPIPEGAERSLDLLRQLQDGGVSISNFQLRQPTLDDVFLALTGPTVTESEELTT